MLMALIIEFDFSQKLDNSFFSERNQLYIIEDTSHLQRLQQNVKIHILKQEQPKNELVICLPLSPKVKQSNFHNLSVINSLTKV